MPFLKPNLGRREPPPAARSRLYATSETPAWLAEERARLEGVLAAELERFESGVLDALSEMEHRYAELERVHDEAQRKLHALRELLADAELP